MQWHYEGDRNTTFFHTVATTRRRANSITHIEDESGAEVTSKKLVMGVFVRYYKTLYCQQEVQDHSDLEDFFGQIQPDSYPKVPFEAHAGLIRPPTVEEVKEVLFQMGPDKAAGPDGVTARFLQTKWHLFAHSITGEIRKAFQNRCPPEDWLRSHIVLIPKGEEPVTPKDFRPITIGNLIYRLFMKIIANRIQPHIINLISNNQTAFIKNRNIADNTILIKEVLHSFQTRAYKEKAFLLKTDIGKAFDTLRWPFLFRAMKALNMPLPMIQIIHSCMKISKVTVLINGNGHGFITPTRGLRQGCPMSPYLFIIAMEFLTKLFQSNVQQGVIRGIRLAKTAPP